MALLIVTGPSASSAPFGLIDRFPCTRVSLDGKKVTLFENVTLHANSLANPLNTTLFANRDGASTERGALLLICTFDENVTGCVNVVGCKSWI